MKTINFNNHKFQISKDGILFWFDKQIAIISDLHLEKGSSFGPSGQFLPPYDSEAFHDKNAFIECPKKFFSF